VLHVARRLVENLRADRRSPPLARLAAIDDPERFVWSVLPYAARSFSFCIAVLPRRTARALAAAYLYCRMLDTCEDLAPDASSKQRALREFLARFGETSIAPPPKLTAPRVHDDRDRVYLLLLDHAPLVDRFFLTLPSDQRTVILRLVRRMGEGMVWAVTTFDAQQGALADDEQLSRYCFEVLGNPMLFAEELQRLECGLPADVPPERVALAAQVGESIQLANVARDLEKDCAHGVFYRPRLKEAARAGAPERLAAEVARARRELLERALDCGRAFRPFMAGVPTPRVSLARGGALLMALFTPIATKGERIHPLASIALVLRAVFSRAGFDAVLARLDRGFEEGARRLRASR
jgi:phytoene/squalene synthetase